jgi:hypothetical protein
MKRSDFIQQAFLSHFFLFDLGYDKVMLYDGGIEFGVTFESKKANREISIMWAANNDLRIGVERRYKGLKALFINDRDRKVFIILNQELASDVAFTAIPRQMSEANYADILTANAKFLQERLGPLIKGDEWVSLDQA